MHDFTILEVLQKATIEAVAASDMPSVERAQRRLLRFDDVDRHAATSCAAACAARTSA